MLTTVVSVMMRVLLASALVLAGSFAFVPSASAHCMHAGEVDGIACFPCAIGTVAIACTAERSLNDEVVCMVNGLPDILVTCLL